MIKLGQHWRRRTVYGNKGGHRALIKILNIEDDRVRVLYLACKGALFISKEVILKNYRLDCTWNTKLRRVLND